MSAQFGILLEQVRIAYDDPKIHVRWSVSGGCWEVLKSYDPTKDWPGIKGDRVIASDPDEVIALHKALEKLDV